MTTPNQTAAQAYGNSPDLADLLGPGAFTVDGDTAENWGQNFTKDLVQQLITGPAAGIGAALTDIPSLVSAMETYLGGLPLEVLQQLQAYIPGALLTDFENVESAVAKIMGAISLGQISVDLGEFKTWLSAVYGILQTELHQFFDIIDGLVVTPISTRVTNAVSWFAGLGSQIQNLDGSGNLPQSAVSGLLSALGALLSTSTWQAFLDAIKGSSGGLVTDLTNRIAHLDSGGVFDAAQLGNLANIGAIAQGKITGLVTDLAAKLAQSDFNDLLNNLFDGLGGTTGSTGKTLANVLTIAQSLVTSVGAKALQTDLQTLWNNLVDAFSGTTGSTGKTLANVLTAGQALYTALGAKALQADLQTLWNNLFDAFGGTTGSTGKTLANVFSNAQAFRAVVTADVANMQTLLNNLFDAFAGSSGSSGKTLANVLSQATTIFNNIQSIVDLIHQAVNGGTSTGNLLSTIKTNIQAVFTNLFGSTTLGTVVKKAAIPDVTRDMSSDLQSLNDHIVNSQAGGSSLGNQPVDAATALSAIPHSNIVPPDNPGNGISHDASTNGTPATGTGATLSMTPWTHTVAPGANYMAVRVVAESNSTTAPVVTFGTQTLTPLYTNSVTAVSGDRAYVYIYGIKNPIPGAALVSVSATAGVGGVIWTLEAQATSLIGVSGVATVSGTNGANSSPSHTVFSATGNYVLDAIVVLSSATETLSSYSQTSRYNPGSTFNTSASEKYVALLAGDAPGAATVAFTATASYTTINKWCSIAVTLTPSPADPIGSGFRRTRVSTSTVTLAANPGTFPNSFFDTADKLTSDIGYSVTGNTATISVAGWYVFEVKVRLSASMGTTDNFGVLLYQNGSPARWGTSISANSRDVSSTFPIWCNAGDTIQPGYEASSSTGGIGEATGTRCYWGGCLANRGIIS